MSKEITLCINDEDFDSFCEHLSSWNHCPYELGLNGYLTEGCLNVPERCRTCYAQAIETSIKERFENANISVEQPPSPEPLFCIGNEEATRLCEFMELNFLKYIRADEDIDNMSWLVLMTDLFKRMADFCQYNGFTYRVGDKDDV